MLWGGKPAEIVKAAEEDKISIVTSEEIVREISQVLTYPRLRKIYRAEDLLHEDLIEAVLKICKFVKVNEKLHVALDHPADDKFIECASAAGADYIVSGDKHLLKIVRYKKTQILSVSGFLQVIKTK